MPLLLIRYGEIALKGKNRPFFEKKLHKNIRNTLKGLEPFQVTFEKGRFFISITSENISQAQERLQKVFGIISISRAARVSLDLQEICIEALQLLKDNYKPGMTFKVNTHRSNKSFHLTSPKINSTIGAYVLDSELDIQVDVHNPQLLLTVEIRNKGAYLYAEEAAGPGGLPVGVNGKGILLLSGGLDSPVAGWMALKRGIELEALYFHSPPFTGEGSVNKAVDLCKVLATYGGTLYFHLAPFTELQKQIRLNCPESLMITLMRRAMLRVAEKLAYQRKAGVLFTGESLGQVSSQTLENLAATNEVASLPILRPLIGFDKEEIIDRARKIESYDISIRPFEDCCTLFVPPHPATRPSLAELQEAENMIPLKELEESCLGNIETIKILPRGGER